MEKKLPANVVEAALLAKAAGKPVKLAEPKKADINVVEKPSKPTKVAKKRPVSIFDKIKAKRAENNDD